MFIKLTAVLVALEHIDSQLLLTQVGKAGISASFSRSQELSNSADQKWQTWTNCLFIPLLPSPVVPYISFPWRWSSQPSWKISTKATLTLTMLPWTLLKTCLAHHLISGTKHEESSPSQILCQCPTDGKCPSHQAQWNDSMSHYLHRLEPGLSTVPCQHSGWHHFPSARSPPHKWKYSCCCTQTLLRMGSNPCSRGRGSPELRTQWLKEECQIWGLSL